MNDMIGENSEATPKTANCSLRIQKEYDKKHGKFGMKRRDRVPLLYLTLVQRISEIGERKESICIENSRIFVLINSINVQHSIIILKSNMKNCLYRSIAAFNITITCPAATNTDFSL